MYFARDTFLKKAKDMNDHEKLDQVLKMLLMLASGREIVRKVWTLGADDTTVYIHFCPGRLCS